MQSTISKWFEAKMQADISHFKLDLIIYSGDTFQKPMGEQTCSDWHTDKIGCRRQHIQLQSNNTYSKSTLHSVLNLLSNPIYYGSS